MKTKKAFTQFIAVIISMLCMICNCNMGLVLSVAAEEATGFESTDSANAPNDYIPIESSNEIASFSLKRSAANASTKRVLLIEDTLPWSSNANSIVLSSLGISYDKVKASDFLSQDLGDYSVLIFANDQQFSTYANYSSFMTQVENFASLGGVVVFGACDGGWAGGTLSTALPCGVTKFTQHANYNYIVNSSHPIITGELIDNNSLSDSDLYSNLCSHVSFTESSLPTGSTIILRDKVSNSPTLVEYPVGDGKVIASGLTWEHSYVNHINDSYGHFAQKAMADLFMYAVSISNADVNMLPPIALSVMGDDYISTTNISYVTASIKNIGDGRASNVKLTVTVPDGIEITDGSDSNSSYWSGLGVGETESCEWGLRIKKGFVVPGAEQVAEIKIRLEYLVPDTLEIESKEIVKKLYVDEEKNAIIVVPGIAGTRLFANSDMDSKDYLLPEFNVSKHNKYSYNAGHQFWEPETSKGTNAPAAATYYQNEIQSEVMMLICDATGNSLADIRPEISFENAQYGAQNTYTKLVNNLKTEFGNEYYVDFFAYDWRGDVSTAAIDLETYINEQEYDNVILVCHSMGGLVASKYLVNSEQNQDKVDKLITIGTPYLGAPKALYVFESGHLLDWATSTFCMATPIKAIANNLTSCYELLPTQQYFDLNDTTYVQYQNNNGFWKKKTTNKQSYSETQDLIKARNWYLDNGTPKNFIDVSESFAESLFVNNEHITSKVDSYYIIGYNKDTILEVEEEYNKNGSFDSCRNLTITNGGDETVPVISANIGGLANSEKTYYIQETHTGMVKNSNVLTLIGNIINDIPDEYSDKFSKSCPETINEKGWFNTDKTVRIQLKIECPVDLAILDQSGSEWAYVNSDYIYNTNADDGTFYLLGKDNDTKMAYLQDKNFDVKLIGTDSGTMNYTMSVYNAGYEINRFIFENVKITSTTVIYTNTNRHGEIILNVDEDNDGIIDYHIYPDYSLNEYDIIIEENEVSVDFEQVSIISSNPDIGVQLYADAIQLNNSIFTDGKCELFSNNFVLAKENIYSLYINNQLKESKHDAYYSDISKYIEDYFSDTSDILPKNAISSSEIDMIYYIEDNLSDFVTNNSIVLSIPSVVSNQNCLTYSKNGNISIYSSDVNYNGMIYAPNGTVTIYADNINITGTIIADKVIISGSNVTFN